MNPCPPLCKYFEANEFSKSSIENPVDVKTIEQNKNNNLKIDINAFNLDTICNIPSIMLIGKRASGKTYIIKELMYKLYETKQIDEFVIITNTKGDICEEYKFLDNVHPQYEHSILENILIKQKQRFSRGEKTKVMVILDNCIASKGDWRTNPSFQEMLYNSRSYNISLLLSMQYPLEFPADARSNFDYIFLLADDYISNKKRIYNYYTGMYPTFDTFNDTFEQLTNDHNAMVIVNRGIRKTIFEKICQHRAVEIKTSYRLPSNVTGDNETGDNETGDNETIANQLIKDIKFKAINNLLNLNTRVSDILENHNNENHNNIGMVADILENTSNILNLLR